MPHVRSSSAPLIPDHMKTLTTTTTTSTIHNRASSTSSRVSITVSRTSTPKDPTIPSTPTPTTHTFPSSPLPPPPHPASSLSQKLTHLRLLSSQLSHLQTLSLTQPSLTTLSTTLLTTLQTTALAYQSEHNLDIKLNLPLTLPQSEEKENNNKTPKQAAHQIFLPTPPKNSEAVEVKIYHLEALTRWAKWLASLDLESTSKSEGGSIKGNSQAKKDLGVLNWEISRLRVKWGMGVRADGSVVVVDEGVKGKEEKGMEGVMRGLRRVVTWGREIGKGNGNGGKRKVVRI